MEDFKIFTKYNNIYSPYVIAEIGSNYNQDLQLAYKLIEEAARCGVNAVKFQLFKAKSLFSKKDAQYNSFKALELNYKWIPKLIKNSKEHNLDFLCSAFDLESLKHLEKNKIEAHKIASSEVQNLKLLFELGKTNKPVFLSTGMSDFSDITLALEILSLQSSNDIILMQCGSVYPLEEKEANLGVINSLKKISETVGFSDHTLGNKASIIALGLGATVFEKHFTFDKKSEGPDHFYALEPDELKKYVENLHHASKIIGSEKKVLLKDEVKYGRRDGLYYKKKLKKGNIISNSDLEVKRPSLGVRSKYKDIIIGSKLKKNVLKGNQVDFNDLTIL